MAKKTVDVGKLRKDVESGMPANEIKKKYGLKTHIQIRELYLKALVKSGDAKPIVGSRPSPTVLTIAPGGVLTIPRDYLQAQGYNPGEKVRIRKWSKGLHIKKIDEKEDV